MVRGNIPRQPSRAGRQDKVKSERVVTTPLKVTESPTLSPKKRATRVGHPGRPSVEAKSPTPPKEGGVGHPKPTLSPKSGDKGRAPSKLRKTERYNPLAPERISEILRRLDERYPNVKCALHHNSAWELLVATILSAQCTDARVNMVTPVIFKKYPTPADFAALK